MRAAVIFCRLLPAALVTAAAAASPALADAPRVPPADAPAGCVLPAGAASATSNDFSELLARGPRKIGTYKLVAGQTLNTPKLRLKVGSTFIPERGGSSRGETLTSVSVSLRAELDRDGPSYKNTVDETGLGPVRLGTYRVSFKRLPVKSKQAKYEALVEDLGCPAAAVHPPLAPGESLRFWVSTEGVGSYSFSSGDWFESDPVTLVAVTADLDPQVQQTPGAKPHGWINLQALENLNLPPTSLDHRYDQLAGAKIALPNHVVEVQKVVLGADTVIDPERPVTSPVITNGRPPVVSVLVKITRNPVTPAVPAPLPAPAPAKKR